MGKRFKNADWDLPTSANGNIETWQAVEIAVLMDIRDELKQLNRLLACTNAVSIPIVLRQIARNTSRYRCPTCPRTFESSRGVDQHIRRAHA